MKISMTTSHGKVVTAALEDSDTALDFVSLLPLTLTLDDYHRTEKISDLPKPLTTKGSPAAITPKTGDMAYYAPWGNLAIFYRDFGRSPGLTKLATIDAGIEAFHGSDAVKVVIDVVK